MNRPTSPAPPLDPQKPVQVYRNLNKKCWSVKQGGRVVAHLDSLSLHSVQMTVRAAGRERVRRTRQKNVHAWADGFMCMDEPPKEAVTLSYDPYTDEEFKAGGKPITAARFTHFNTQGKAFVWT